jgi:hypothetical protein
VRRLESFLHVVAAPPVWRTAGPPAGRAAGGTGRKGLGALEHGTAVEQWLLGAWRSAHFARRSVDVAAAAAATTATSTAAAAAAAAAAVGVEGETVQDVAAVILECRPRTPAPVSGHAAYGRQ